MYVITFNHIPVALQQYVCVCGGEVYVCVGDKSTKLQSWLMEVKENKNILQCAGKLS